MYAHHHFQYKLLFLLKVFKNSHYSIFTNLTLSPHIHPLLLKSQFLFWPSYSRRFATWVLTDDHWLLPMSPPTLYFQPVYCQYKFKVLSVSHNCLFFSFSASQFESLQLLNWITWPCSTWERVPLHSASKEGTHKGSVAALSLDVLLLIFRGNFRHSQTI